LARKTLDQFKPFLPLLGILVLWIILPVAVKRSINRPFYEFQAPSTEVLSRIRELKSFWTDRTYTHGELIQHGRDVSRLNAAYRLQIMENETLRKENERLEELLGLPSQPGFRYEVARVTHRQIGSWWQEMIVRKGADHGIPEGAGVVYAGGVVGKVQKVYSGTSVIRLVTSPNFKMVATLQGDSQPLYILGWQNNKPFGVPQGRVRNVPVSLKVSPESPGILVSSRLGGVFPSGLPIGTVQELEQSPSGIFQEGYVTFPPELYQLNEVAILVPVLPSGI
jgi:rod shape-determining protein MreC